MWKETASFSSSLQQAFVLVRKYWALEQEYRVLPWVMEEGAAFTPGWLAWAFVAHRSFHRVGKGGLGFTVQPHAGVGKSYLEQDDSSGTGKCNCRALWLQQNYLALFLRARWGQSSSGPKLYCFSIALFLTGVPASSGTFACRCIVWEPRSRK